MGLIQGARDVLSKTKKTVSTDKKDTTLDNLDHDAKLGALYREYRMEDPNGRLLLNRTWFRTSLYYQGKQQIRWNSETGSLDYFDPTPGDDWYTENQFRRDVISNVSAMCKADMPPQAAPASDRPDDVASAATANHAVETIRDDVDYDRGLVLKNLNLCLYGNAFKYQYFAKDGKKYGTTVVPNYKYENASLPGVQVCPSCGMTKEVPEEQPTPETCPECGALMESVAPQQQLFSKTEDGSTEVENGRNQELITGPLEMYQRSKCQHGLQFQPYLFYVRRLDYSIVKDHRPQIDSTDASLGSDSDLGQYYVDVLSTLAGGPYEGVYRTSGSRFYKEVEYAMCWIRPEAFKGDAELKKKYPDGVMFETCNGRYIPDTAINQSMDDCWTHYVYIINPYSAWGDGMVDALPVQDQINEINSLLVRYLRYCTVGKVIYDQDMIITDWLSNNPDEAWIPANRQVDKKLSDSVWPVQPVNMSQDVGQWKQSLYATMQDMTHAYDASQGKSLGANTPYSSYVFQAEQAAGWFLATFKYNRASTLLCVRQQLDLFRKNTVEQRFRKFKDNTGKWSFDQFMGSDLSQGSFDIYISDSEGQPKTKAEKAHGLELYANIAPLMPTLSQKQRVYVLDLIGMPPDANPDTLMSQKAYRDIETIVKKGEDVTPNGFILDIPVYCKTIKEYLAGEEGDELAAEHPEQFVKVFQLMITTLMQGQMQTAAMPPHGPTPGAPGQKPGGPAQQGNGAVNQPKPPQQEQAQAPVPPGQQQTMPSLPPGARQS